MWNLIEIGEFKQFLFENKFLAHLEPYLPHIRSRDLKTILIIASPIKSTIYPANQRESPTQVCELFSKLLICTLIPLIVGGGNYRFASEKP